MSNSSWSTLFLLIFCDGPSVMKPPYKITAGNLARGRLGLQLPAASPLPSFPWPLGFPLQSAAEGISYLLQKWGSLHQQPLSTHASGPQRAPLHPGPTAILLERPFSVCSFAAVISVKNLVPRSHEAAPE